MTAFARILLKYGDTGVRYDGAEAKGIRVFIQPMMTRRTEKVWSRATRLGERDTSRYLAFLPPEAEAGAGDTLSVDGRDYEFIKAERFKVNGSASHVEAVLRIKEAVHVD